MKRCLSCGHRFDAADWRCPSCGDAPATAQGFPVFAPDISDTYGLAGSGVSFELLASVQDRHFWFITRNALIGAFIRRYLGMPAAILEIGCGTGNVLAGLQAAFPEARLWGSDIHVEGLAFARRAARAELMQMDARDIPFAEHFDVVVACDVLEHIEDDVGVLRGLRDAVRPGGGVLLTVPQHPFLWSSTDERSFHLRRYRARELRDKLARAGFAVARMTSFMTLPFPLMALSRLVKYRAKGSDPADEYRIRPAANAVLNAMVALERRMILGGLDLPFGGSLLVAAKRI